MKTVEELNAFKEEVESLNKKLAELSEEELEQAAGGIELGSADAIIKPDLDIHRIDEHPINILK